MGFHQVSNVVIKGISTCVPEQFESISSLELFRDNEAEKFSKNTGINKRHFANTEICTSDLCFKAADELINKLKWDKQEIDVLIFVTQTPDYILPATSNILQNRLGLTKDCYCLDISLGCSGYIYGMSLISILLQNSAFKKGILLVGDTITKLTSNKDKSVYPLFGDAGTATALEFDLKKESKISFNLGGDGSGENAIKITHGGARNLFDESCLVYNITDQNNPSNLKRSVDLSLNGVDVFNFAIKTVPDTIKKLLEKIDMNLQDIDIYVLHQANLFMNETIRKKLKLDSEKFIYSIESFGNTNGASIPLTLCSNYSNNIVLGNYIMCGFGVGLSWGALHYKNEEEIVTIFSYL